jgi:AraC-like DNA-binding protein
MAANTLLKYVDESVPVHADIGRRHPMVIFGDHRFCAGKSLIVHEMPQPHMHSQIELNFVLDGAMTYWFNGQMLTVSIGRLALFWGMIPHQVTSTQPETRFVCFYVPISVFLGLPTLSRLREAIFRGAVIEAIEIKPFDRDIFLRWREELLTGDPHLEAMVRDEMTARVRRLDHEGWRDLRAEAPLAFADTRGGAERMLPIEKMTRFIGENGRSKISVVDVAGASGLHPNYAMQLFRHAVGMSIKEAITRHRLDAAQSLLIASDRAIAAIAFDCGFASLSSFYAAFAKRFVESPARFRRALGHHAT